MKRIISIDINYIILKDGLGTQIRYYTTKIYLLNGEADCSIIVKQNFKILF